MSKSDSLVIIGAGECGTRAAIALREGGHAGAVILIGAEEGLPYERPPLSKEVLTEAEPAPRTIADAARLSTLGITYRPGVEVGAIDRARRRVWLADGETVAYDRLLLATGARPRPLVLPGAEGPNTAVLRTWHDAMRLRAALGPGRRIVLIGGGFIGLELAASARRLGTIVTLIEAQSRLLTRAVPAAIAETLSRRHRAEGVDLRLEARIERITAEGVLLLDGTLLPADLVVIGIGAIPNIELAAAAGLAIDNGIAVDRTLRTSDPAIFAAGDCCAFPEPRLARRIRLESWRGAQEMGTLAARNMLGADAPMESIPWFWSDQYDLTLQVTGISEGAVTEIRRDLGEAFILFHLAADGTLISASGIGPGNSVARDIRLAEIMIARRIAPDPVALSAAASLKKLLAA